MQLRAESGEYVSVFRAKLVWPMLLPPASSRDQLQPRSNCTYKPPPDASLKRSARPRSLADAYGIDRGLKDARAGRLAMDKQVAAILAKHRRA